MVTTVKIDTMRIKRTMMNRKISSAEMCRRAKMKLHNFYMIVDKDYPPTWDDLCGIADVLGCEPHELILKE